MKRVLLSELLRLGIGWFYEVSVNEWSWEMNPGAGLSRAPGGTHKADQRAL